MRTIWSFLTLCLASTPLVSLSSQTIQYSGGTPNGLTGYEFTAWVEADAFTLSNTTQVTDVRFWAFASPQSAPGWTGQISWFVYADAGGLPGATLFSGTQAGMRVADGTVLTSTLWRHDLAIDVSLNAGTYWLGLVNGTLPPVCSGCGNSSRQYYWASTTDVSPNRGAYYATGSAPNWSNGGDDRFDMAFQLYGTAALAVDGDVAPEPAAIGLFGLGLVGLAGHLTRGLGRRM